MGSQVNCDAKECASNGGKPPPCSLLGTCSMPVLCAGSAIVSPILQREQQQQRDQQREDAERFGDGEAEDQVAELTLRSGRIAKSGCKIVAEDDADANTG